MFVDMPLARLRDYLPAREEPGDFDAFWQRTLEQARSHELDARFERIETEIVTADVYDVTFNGFGGHPIKAWLLTPVSGPAPCVIEYQGYGGGRGLPVDWLAWPSFGYAVLAVDSRGQGAGGWRRGDTPDPHPGSGPTTPGVMTSGILDPAQYYYRRLYTDAARAVETARAHPAITKIAVSGGSQGGGIALAAAALSGDVDLALIDVPFMQHIRHAVDITAEHPYQELAVYCKAFKDQVEQVFQTVSYFDGLNFAARSTAPALYSVALRDGVTPPSTVFASFNHYAGADKEIEVYPYNGHEGGESTHLLAKVRKARKVLG